LSRGAAGRWRLNCLQSAQQVAQIGVDFGQVIVTALVNGDDLIKTI
jgi:hypothetical protein